MFVAMRRACLLAFGMGWLAAGLHAAQLQDAPAGLDILRTLPLEEAQRAGLQAALDRHDYAAAEELLAGEAGRRPRAAAILVALGHVLFLDGKHAQAVLALKKADAIAPLDERSRFLLALAYIALRRPSLARPELGKLAGMNPASAVYPYWLSRIEYRKTDVRAALEHAQKAVQLDPAFMKAYDQLGLCYEALGDFDAAAGAFRKAIGLSAQSRAPSPWPSLNLGVMLLRTEKIAEAEERLRDSVRIEPKFPVAHFRLGQALERQARYPEAVAELKEAGRLDPTYPEPHYALARIYRRQGDARAAAAEIAQFRSLRAADKAKGITRPD